MVSYLHRKQGIAGSIPAALTVAVLQRLASLIVSQRVRVRIPSATPSTIRITERAIVPQRGGYLVGSSTRVRLPPVALFPTLIYTLLVKLNIMLVFEISGPGLSPGEGTRRHTSRSPGSRWATRFGSERWWVRLPRLRHQHHIHPRRRDSTAEALASTQRVGVQLPPPAQRPESQGRNVGRKPT